MMMRELVVKIGLLSATILVTGVLISSTTAHAESKKGGIFGKSYDHDFTPGGDPARGPGLLDNAVIRVGGTVIRTGTEAEKYNGTAAGRAAEARKARQLQRRSIDATTPN